MVIGELQKQLAEEIQLKFDLDHDDLKKRLINALKKASLRIKSLEEEMGLAI